MGIGPTAEVHKTLEQNRVVQTAHIDGVIMSVDVEPISSPASKNGSAASKLPASPNATQAARPAEEAVATDCQAVVVNEKRRTSTKERLKRFTEHILSKAASPQMPTVPHEQPSAKLPKWSRRIAAQPLSRVPASKHGEILIMKCLGFLHEQATSTSTTVS